MAIGLCVTFWSVSAAAAERPLFCVLVPHFKDDYWLSIGYGLEKEAARQNVDLVFFEAGGYRARAEQVRQLDVCAERDVDAILIGAVTSAHPNLTNAITRIAKEVPVFALVNAVHSDSLSGRIGVDWHDMGRAVGMHLKVLHPVGSVPKTAVLISGPDEAGWTGPLESGLRAALQDSAVTITEVFGADTGLRQQLSLVETALERHPDVDYLIGSAPAIEAAIGFLEMRSDMPRPVLVSTYISHTIKRGLMNGGVMAAPFDDPIEQGVMALRQAVTGGGSPPRSVRMIGPDIVLLKGGYAALDGFSLSPADYFPAIQ